MWRRFGLTCQPHFVKRRLQFVVCEGQQSVALIQQTEGKRFKFQFDVPTERIWISSSMWTSNFVNVTHVSVVHVHVVTWFLWKKSSRPQPPWMGWERRHAQSQAFGPDMPTPLCQKMLAICFAWGSAKSGLMTFSFTQNFVRCLRLGSIRRTFWYINIIFDNSCSCLPQSVGIFMIHQKNVGHFFGTSVVLWNENERVVS